MVTRRNFSSEFKAKVVLELLREEETLSQIAARHKIHHTVLQNWKRTVTDGLPGLFADPRRRSADEYYVPVEPLVSICGATCVCF